MQTNHKHAARQTETLVIAGGRARRRNVAQLIFKILMEKVRITEKSMEKGFFSFCRATSLGGRLKDASELA